MNSLTTNVILIDDNEVDNFISRSVIELAKGSDHIQDFVTAAQALDFLKEIQAENDEIPDLIFLDINMPVMNGFMFLEKFGTLPEQVTKKVKIVMLSSSANPDDIVKSNENPFVFKYLDKPLTIEKFKNLYS